jgi:hypothetical protein
MTFFGTLGCRRHHNDVCVGFRECGAASGHPWLRGFYHVFIAFFTAFFTPTAEDVFYCVFNAFLTRFFEPRRHPKRILYQKSR